MAAEVDRGAGERDREDLRRTARRAGKAGDLADGYGPGHGCTGRRHLPDPPGFRPGKIAEGAAGEDVAVGADADDVDGVVRSGVERRRVATGRHGADVVAGLLRQRG